MWIHGTSMILTGDDVPFTYIWVTRWTCFPLWYIDPCPGDESFLDGNDFFVLSGGLTYLYESYVFDLFMLFLLCVVYSSSILALLQIRTVCRQWSGVFWIIQNMSASMLMNTKKRENREHESTTEHDGGV